MKRQNFFKLANFSHRTSSNDQLATVEKWVRLLDSLLFYGWYNAELKNRADFKFTLNLWCFKKWLYYQNELSKQFHFFTIASWSLELVLCAKLTNLKKFCRFIFRDFYWWRKREKFEMADLKNSFLVLDYSIEINFILIKKFEPEFLLAETSKFYGNSKCPENMFILAFKLEF